MEDFEMRELATWGVACGIVFFFGVIGSFIWIMGKNSEVWERFKKGYGGSTTETELKETLPNCLLEGP
tara:strand:- start:404 stop:607 length:204 start_codon:yes stop_codon:yes gene_type:complete